MEESKIYRLAKSYLLPAIPLRMPFDRLKFILSNRLIIVALSLPGDRTPDRNTLTEDGEKFIAVHDEGKLEIYGQFKRSWTKLTATVKRMSPLYRHQVMAWIRSSKVTRMNGLHFRRFNLMWDHPNASSAKWKKISYCLINKDLC